MKFPQWMDLRKNPYAPGQIFDHGSYWGIFRSLFFIASSQVFFWWLVEGTNNEEGYKSFMRIYFYSCYFFTSLNLLDLLIGTERIKRFFSRIGGFWKKQDDVDAPEQKKQR